MSCVPCSAGLPKSARMENDLAIGWSESCGRSNRPRSTNLGSSRSGIFVMDYLSKLENQSIYIMREAFNKFENLAMLWSIGKDSTVLLWLARKAFFRSEEHTSELQSRLHLVC